MADHPVRSAGAEEAPGESEERGTGLIPAWSYSRLSIFEKCPYRAYLAYVEKRPEPEDTDRTALERGKMVHEAAEAFVKGERDDLIPELVKFEDEFQELRDQYEDGMSIAEEQWAYDRDWNPLDNYFSEGVWLRMALDHFRWLDEDKTRASFIDYKTGKERPVPHAQQRMLYALGSFMKFPELEEVEGGFWYTDVGPHKTRPRTYVREEAMKFLPSWNERALAMTEATEFPAKPNRMNCKWCPYGEHKGDKSCPWRAV